MFLLPYTIVLINFYKIYTDLDKKLSKNQVILFKEQP